MENNSNEVKVRKGAWTKEEDTLLTKCIQTYGEGKWHLVPPRAGLNRCRKSCRMRWLNYLKPNVKRGYFDPAEVDLIQRMHKLLGNRWSLIAGRIPGRTANDVKNFWNTHICKKQHPSKSNNNINIAAQATTNIIIKPQPRNLTLSQPQPQPQPLPQPQPQPQPQLVDAVNTNTCSSSLSSPLLQEQEDCEDRCSRLWEHMLQMSQNGQDGDVAPLSCPGNDTDINKDDDGFMSGLLLDFDAWENIGAPTQFHVQK